MYIKSYKINNTVIIIYYIMLLLTRDYSQSFLFYLNYVYFKNYKKNLMRIRKCKMYKIRGKI